ncbi:hypothetical protein FOVG_16585 [Fusarium oxysporum f. sp. pisi HDV247]|uniref:Uncharacterized protein n=1 Tax=Fusarium oxysporum f. sp. pisi HDV247 TaxID=1080344 RepID=W9NHN4_FUSOX|nr:hypothetical protein FOVG_16585 [Fusarium oxysporum f. sp. pisi HDV247]
MVGRKKSRGEKRDRSPGFRGCILIFPGFLSGMIRACLHWSGITPSSSDAWKMARTSCFTDGQTCFQTIAGSPSSPGA